MSASSQRCHRKNARQSHRARGVSQLRCREGEPSSQIPFRLAMMRLFSRQLQLAQNPIGVRLLGLGHILGLAQCRGGSAVGAEQGPVDPGGDHEGRAEDTDDYPLAGGQVTPLPD
ncbi:MAG: hypothetical protein EOP32_26195 [Rhodococcus sp. (in: high G+C Gram-positive bacteria)]|nr:MAG: hypothetical protein EOP32_26195 [Rhodococcus sp. (in: high G+C Gram-positive bacteria)]